MKRCSKCGQFYSDESLNFCLSDGSPLVEVGSEATVVIPRDQPRKRSKVLLWLGLGVLAIVLGVIGLAAAIFFRYSGSDTTVSINTANSQSAKATPSPAKTQSGAAPSPTPAEDENTNLEEEPEANPEDDSSLDEPTPIGWDTTAAGFKGEPGKTYTFQCPANGTSHYGVFGSDVYTDYSSICNAAVHMGAISVEKGGIVTIEYRPGRQIYGSTERNGIKTHTTGEARRSFVIKTAGSARKS